MTTVSAWGCQEVALESARDRADPSWEVDLHLEVTVLSGPPGDAGDSVVYVMPDDRDWVLDVRGSV